MINVSYKRVSKKFLEIFVYPKRWPKSALKWTDWLTVLTILKFLIQISFQNSEFILKFLVKMKSEIRKAVDFLIVAMLNVKSTSKWKRRTIRLHLPFSNTCF